MSENVITYDPIFPVMMASVLLNLPVTDMVDYIRQIDQQENSDVGFTTHIGSYNSENLKPMPGYLQLEEAILGVITSFARELKYDVDPERCGIQLWANSMKKGGFHSIHNHPHSSFSGCFYLSCSENTSPLLIHNPTMPFRMHEPFIVDPTNYTAFTAPSLTITPKVNTMFVWPSWLSHSVPKMKTNEERISIAFNVDYLPIGA